MSKENERKDDVLGIVGALVFASMLIALALILFGIYGEDIITVCRFVQEQNMTQR